MPLSPQALDELQDEYERLAVQAHELAAVLRRYNRLPSGRAASAEATDGPAERQGATAKGASRQANPTTLRDTILGVLSSRARAYKPGELAGELERHGVTVGNADTPLSVRVGVELARLHQEGQVTKDPTTARYKLRDARPPAAGNGATAADDDFEDFPGLVEDDDDLADDPSTEQVAARLNNAEDDDLPF